jgi:hypothetical protein
MTAKKIGFAVTSLTKSEIIGKLTGHPKLSRVLATEIMELLVRIIRHHMENGGSSSPASARSPHRNAKATSRPIRRTRRRRSRSPT